MITFIMGIHSNVAGDGAALSAGHAWVTITQKGKTTFYGLWPDAHPRTVDNGDASDIRIGLEVGRPKMSVLGSIFCPLFGPGNIDHNTYYDWF